MTDRTRNRQSRSELGGRVTVAPGGELPPHYDEPPGTVRISVTRVGEAAAEPPTSRTRARRSRILDVYLSTLNNNPSLIMKRLTA